MLQRILFVTAFLLLLAPPSFAGFEEGKKAYDGKDWLKAITELRPLAERGDDRAMILLGNMYSEGFGVIKSPQTAMGLYKRAAIVKNNPEAMLAVAAMYTSGIGTRQNLNTAMQWFMRAAQLGNSTGAFFYATILFRGNKSAADDIKPDFYNSYKWFRIAEKNAHTPKISAAAKELADRIAKQKLISEEVLRADKEVAEWKPANPFTLGPVPADPVEGKKP